MVKIDAIQSERLSLSKYLLEKSRFYKIDLASTNITEEEVEFLSFIYTMAGFSAFDIAAQTKFFKPLQLGINKAIKRAKQENIALSHRPFVIVSIFNDSYLNNNSTQLEKLIPNCIEFGAEIIELHIGKADEIGIIKNLNLIKKYAKGHIISISLSRFTLSNTALFEIINSAASIFQDRLIIEVDSFERRDGADDFNTTLQAISTADIINKQIKLNKPNYTKIPILLAGGTNSLTMKLAKQCDVDFNGVTFRRYGRKIISLCNQEVNITCTKYNIKESIKAAIDLFNQFN